MFGSKETRYILLLSVIAVISTHILEYYGIMPCKLCKYQRYIYYLIIFWNFTILYFDRKILYKYSSIITYSILTIELGVAIFQLLIENNIIEYNSSCTAGFGDILSADDLLNAINSKDLVPCDVPQFLFLNMSLSAWNAIYIIFIMIIPFISYKINNKK